MPSNFLETSAPVASNPGAAQRESATTENEESGAAGDPRHVTDATSACDPKSLWKELDPDEALPYRKSHTASERKTSDGFTLIAASRRGRAHAHVGGFREDDFAMDAGNGWAALAVADGAGSAKFSREGARLACQTTIETLINGLTAASDLDAKIDAWRTTGDAAAYELRTALYAQLCGAAFEAYKRIEREAQRQKCAVTEYAATLLFAAAKSFPDGVFVAGFGIGDGVIGAYRTAVGEVRPLNSPDGGEFAGQTAFLTVAEAFSDGNGLARRIQFDFLKPPVAIFLMTDGVSDPKFGATVNLSSNEKWREFYRDVSTAAAIDSGGDAAAEPLLEWLNFWARGEHDDRTLGVILAQEGDGA
jgi:hypothetical protein